MPFWEVFQVALVAGVLGVDRLAFGQFMISQPILAAPIIGGLLGDFHTGFLVGVVLELFWLRGLPVGGHVPRDATLSAILTTSLSLAPFRPVEGMDTAWIAWVFLWAGVLLVPAGFLDQMIRRKNACLIQVARSSSRPDRGVAKAVFIGVLVFFSYYAGITWLILWFSGPLLGKGYAILSGQMLQGLRVFFFLLPVIGVASLLTYKDLRSGRILLLSGGAASFLLCVGLGQQNGLVLAALFVLALGMVFAGGRAKVLS